MSGAIEVVAKAEIAKNRTVVEDAAAMTKALGAAVLTIPEVSTPEQAQWITDRGLEAHEIAKKATAERDRVSKPIRKLATDLAAPWNQVIKSAEAIKDHAKRIAIAYQTKAQAQATAALANAVSPSEIASAVAVVAAPPVGIQTRESWTWELEDISKIPHDYFVLDTARLDREVRERKSELNVPGIRAVNKPIGVFR